MVAVVQLRSGQKIEMDEAKAIKIQSIIDGHAEPENVKQAEFVKTVARVMLPVKPAPRPVGKPIEDRPSTKPHDKELDKIYKNKKLSGYEKARAVIERIKSR